jgi:hypothetical protein
MKKQEEEESVCRQVNIQAIANWKKHGQHL